MALRYAILTALIEDDLSGYDLARSFDKSLGFFWKASHQQIYRELKLLSERGWIKGTAEAQKGKPDRIVYALTDEGRGALDEWVLQKDRMRLQETRDELFIKLYNLSESNVGYMHARISERREEMMRRLFLYERIRRNHYADPDSLPLRRKGVYLALMGGITQGEQYLTWCDDALQMLAGELPDTDKAASASADTA